MSTYTLYSNGVLEKDGSFLVIDDRNPDYLDYLAWVALGNSPILADGSVYIAKLAAAKLDREQIKAEYINMINRLEQIQTAVNPTNAQVIQAVKDEALYIERIMKFIKQMVT